MQLEFANQPSIIVERETQYLSQNSPFFRGRGIKYLRQENLARVKDTLQDRSAHINLIVYLILRSEKRPRARSYYFDHYINA